MPTMITAQAVKDLREKTGVGMMDCRRALEATDGDMEKAVEHLRKAGIAKAEKKASRTTKEGCVAIQVTGNVAAVVEVLCETDFVAKNDRFKGYVAALLGRVATGYTENGDVSEKVRAAEKEELGVLVGAIGENIQVRRAVRWQSSGQLCSYIHMAGKIGVLVDASGEAGAVALGDVCMHVAAFSPRYVGPADVSAEVLAKEQEIAAAQVQGKPANVMEKIVEGKVQKWFSDVCLVRQPWIRDDKTCLQKLAPKLTVGRFLRWQIGEEV